MSKGPHFDILEPEFLPGGLFDAGHIVVARAPQPGLTSEDRLLRVPLRRQHLSLQVTKKGLSMSGCLAAPFGCIGAPVVFLVQAVVFRALDREHSYFTLTIRETGEQVRARAHPHILEVIEDALRRNA